MSQFATNQIRAALSRIEDEEGMRILYACESGSRAWGFESEDSDYDVRFLYLRPTEFSALVDRLVGVYVSQVLPKGVQDD